MLHFEIYIFHEIHRISWNLKSGRFHVIGKIPNEPFFIFINGRNDTINDTVSDSIGQHVVCKAQWNIKYYGQF